MSSARNRDGDNPVQLFPFVAVLLCTMGALLVLLVSVARSSKARALEDAAQLRAQARAAAVTGAAASQEKAQASRRELEKILVYQRELDAARRQANQVLRQDRARMAHLEDHMRRLREELEKMKLAAAELNSLEGARFDDRREATAEVDRLQQLINETREKIERMRDEAKRRAKSYAIVPYQSRSGTRRRPIYIECRETDAVLQPEGIVLTLDDFRPPIGPGNPLVAALRAAGEHIRRNELSGEQGKAAEPYPLIIVRPAGVKFYYYVREAIQSWDSEFGYELVEEDWDLKYGAADPQLATVEFDAAEAARARLRALADAAPQAYGAYRFGGGAGDSWGGDFSDGDGDGDGGGSYDSEAAGNGGDRMAGTGRPSGYAVGESPRVASRPGGGGRYATVIVKRQDANDSSGVGARNETGTGPGSGRGAQPSSDSTANATADSSPTGQTSGDPAQVAQGNVSPNGAAGAQGPSGNNQPLPDSLSTSRSYTGGHDAEQQLGQMARNAAAEADGAAPQRRQKVRGKNWAIRNANPGMIPIRRTIQIEVRGDALVILPEASTANSVAAAGKQFPFNANPSAAYEDLLTAVDNRIEDWGMAGQGLYWRPVIELRVSGDGDRRVDQLVRLLEHGGAELRGESVAKQGKGGANGTTQ